MNPVAFTIFGFDVRWYGVIIGLGILISIAVAEKLSKIKSVNFDEMLNLILIALPVGIIGARLYYVVFDWNLYKSNPIEMFNIRGGGLAIHGGLIFGIGSAAIYAYKKRLNILNYVDIAAPSIILAQAIGRWGNFFNSEAHGGPVSEKFIQHFPKFIQKGMYIQEGNLPASYYHPTFLYESCWDLLTFFILILILSKTNKKGIVFAAYILLYSTGRFFIEGLRTDSLMIGPLKIAQVISLVGITLSLAFIIMQNHRKHQ